MGSQVYYSQNRQKGKLLRCSTCLEAFQFYPFLILIVFGPNVSKDRLSLTFIAKDGNKQNKKHRLHHKRTH